MNKVKLDLSDQLELTVPQVLMEKLDRLDQPGQPELTDHKDQPVLQDQRVIQVMKDLSDHKVQKVKQVLMVVLV